MVTKEQERKALEQIKKNVDSLGADSYIATAFDGCFEDARENIENDFALCMKDRYETERKRAKDLQEEVDRLKADLRKEKECDEELGKAIKKTQEQENATIQMIESERDALKCQVADLLDRESELVSLRDDAECRAEVAEAEIIRLKAKLYDLIVGSTSAYKAEQAGKKLVYLFYDQEAYGDRTYYYCEEDDTVYSNYFSIGD